MHLARGAAIGATCLEVRPNPCARNHLAGVMAHRLQRMTGPSTRTRQSPRPHRSDHRAEDRFALRPVMNAHRPDWITRFFMALLSAPAAVMVAVLLVTGYLAYRSTELRFDFTPEQLFVSNDPDVDFFRDYRDRVFRSDDNIVMIAIRPPELFSREGVELVRKVAAEIKGYPHVAEVDTLFDIDTIQPSDGGFAVMPLLADMPASPAGFSAVKARALDQPMVVDRLVSRDGTTTAIALRIDKDITDEVRRKPLIDKLVALTERLEAENPALKGNVHIAGIAVSQAVMIGMMKGDQGIFIPLAGLIMMVVLLAVFRGFVGMIVPMSVVALALIWTLGFMVVTGEFINIMNNVIFTLILVYGIGDSIHIQARYREELSHGRPKQAAILGTMRELALACFLTSVTTVIGFVSLASAKMSLIQRMGYYAGFGVAAAYVASMLVAPVMLHFMKPLPAPPSPSVSGGQHGLLDRAMLKLGDLTVQHPWAMLGTGVVLTVIGLANVGEIRVESRMNEEVDPSHWSQVSMRFVEQNLTGVLPFDVSFDCHKPDCVKQPEVLRAMEKVQQALSPHKSVTHTHSLADLLKEMNRAMFIEDATPTDDQRHLPPTREGVGQYLLLFESTDGAARQLRSVVNDDFSHARVQVLKVDAGTTDYGVIQSIIAEALKGLPPGVDARITGPTHIGARGVGNIVHDMLSSLATSFIIISLSMMLLFRSVRLGLLSMVPNIVPVAFAVGLMGILDIKMRIATTIIFAIALGIAVDNTIHIIARFEAELRKHRDYPLAIRETVLHTGRAVLFSSGVLFLGISVVGLSNFIAIRHFALLTDVALLLAVYGALVLMPALLMVTKPVKIQPEKNG
jgi:uncharacterized protein